MMLSKVFLQHLAPLSTLPTFPALWLTILDLVGQFCATASTDLLADALPESLKNMLLVMDTSGGGLFFTSSGHPTPLWGVTWGKIDTFLPGLREELFPGWEKRCQVTQFNQEVNQVTQVKQEVTQVTQVNQEVNQVTQVNQEVIEAPVATTAATEEKVENVNNVPDNTIVNEQAEATVTSSIVDTSE